MVITWVDGWVSNDISNNLLNLWSQARSLCIHWVASFHRLGQVYANCCERQNPVLSHPLLQKQQQNNQWVLQSSHCTVRKQKVLTFRYKCSLTNKQCVKPSRKIFILISNFFKTAYIIELHRFYLLQLLHWIKPNHPALAKNSILLSL